MAHIEFTDNYQDLSTDTGYQYKFFCEGCGNGYMSSWKASKLGVAGGLLRGAGDLLGGVFGRASSSAYDIQRAVGGSAHDSALKEAVEEIRPLFMQCKRCGQWVCREICWNAERGLCKACAPILQREIAAKQASIAVEQVDQKLREQDLLEGVNLKAAAAVLCPKCGAEAQGGKFCPECGAPLVPKTECPTCGAKLTVGSKFCGECGTKV
ncbi:MAG TPA: zinc ribbon domain-containing protein [Holophaga sp.]|nr:zinc ribbon domain-containing protein [Holophaga sp.]